MKHIKKFNEGRKSYGEYSLEVLKEVAFKAWTAGDCEGMRNGDDADRQEFDEWWHEKGQGFLNQL